MRTVPRSTSGLLLALLVTVACRRDVAHRDASATLSPTTDPPCHHGGRQQLEAGTPVPGASLYRFDATFTDASGASVAFPSLRGKPALVVMFYGSCITACPILLGDAERVAAGLGADAARLRFVGVTIDPAHDTPERLRAVQSERRLDASRWTLLRGTETETRTLANLLGVQYRETTPGEFAHSMLLTLLDADGVVVAQVEGLARPVDELVRRARTLF